MDLGQIRAYLDLVRRLYEDYAKIYRCLVSDNPVGTDTHPVGEPYCDCAVCALVAENLKLRVELDRPEPSPTWAELENLQYDYAQLQNDIAELARYTSAHHDCLAGDDDCGERECCEVRKLIANRGEPDELHEALEPLRSDILDAVETSAAWEKVALAMRWEIDPEHRQKRQQLSGELIHAWCGDPEPSDG